MIDMIDIIISIPFIALPVCVIYYHFTSHPSDKYHNDSWREDRIKRFKKR